MAYDHVIQLIAPAYRHRPEAAEFAIALDAAGVIPPDSSGGYAWEDDIPPRETWAAEAAALAKHQRDLGDDCLGEYIIEIDRTGQGHAWREIAPDDLPAAVREEIDAAIIDGDEPPYVASNGQHYRWAKR